MANNAQPLGQMIIEVDISSVGFESSLKDMQRALKQNQQKMKAEMANYDLLQNKIGKLEANYDGLRDSMKLNAKQIDKLKQAYADEVAASGESSEKARELARQINKTVQEQAKYQAQLNRVTSQLTDARDGTEELRKSISLLSTESRSIVNNFRSQGKELEALEADYNGLEQAVEVRTRLIDKEKQKMHRLKQQYGENSEEYRRQVARVRDLETSNNEARNAMNRLENEMDDLANTSSNLKNKIGDLSSNLDGIATALSATAGGIGLAAGKVAMTFDDMKTKIMISLGETEKAAEESVKNIQKSLSKGYETENIADGFITINQVLGDMLSDSEISDMNEEFAALASVMDLDVVEGVRAVNSVMRNFGDTGQEATDAITWGMQNGLNVSGDFLDTLWEYAPQFSKLGYSSKEMLALMSAGMDEGAFSMDKLADGVKEFSLRVTEIDKNGAGALKELGFNAEDVSTAMNKGGDEAKNMSFKIATALSGVKDNTDRNAMSVALFGTQYEDVGDSVVKALGKIDTATVNTKGSADAAKDAYEKAFSTRLRGTISDLGQALQPVGDVMLNFADRIMPAVEEKARALSNWFESLSTENQNLVVGLGALSIAAGPLTMALKFLVTPFKLLWTATKGFFNILKSVGNFLPSMSTVMSGLGKAVDIAYKPIVWLGNGLSKLWNVLKFIAPFIRTGLVTAFRALLGPVGLVITAVSLLVAGFKYAYKHSETFRNFVNKLRDSLLNTWNNLKAMGVRGVVAAMWKSVKGAFATGYTFVKTKIEGAKNAISNAWTNARKLAVAKVTGMWTSTKTLFASGYNAVKSRMASVKNSVSNAWTNTKKAATDKVSSMWTSTKNSFSNGYNAVKNRMSNVKTAMSNSWTAIKKLTVEKVTNMIDHVKKMPQRMADAIAKGAGALKNGGKKLLKGLIGGVEWGLNKVIKGVNQVMTWVGADDSKLKPVDLTKYAKGTPNGGHDGGLAMVNDAPGSNYRELVALPNGQTFVPKGRNVVMNLPQGAEVLPGHKTRDLAKRGVIPQYKSGIGDTLSGLWSSTKSGASKLWQGTKDVSSAAFNKVKDWSTEVWDWVTSPEKVKDLLMNVIGNVIPGEFSSGMVPSMLNGMMKKMVDQAKDFVFNIADSMGGGADFGSWSPFTGDFNKISNKMGVYDYLYDLGKQIVNQFKSQYPSLYISNGKRKESKTKAGTTSDHVYGLGLDLARGGISDNSYYQMAKSLQGHPYLKYVIGSNKWSQNGGEFKKFPYGGHMNHLHLSAKSPAEAKAAKGSFGAAGNVSGSAKAWTAQIKKAHQAIYGRAISKQGLNEVLEQIQTESGGNATVRQGIVDVNTHNGSGGAKGLLQFIQSTFDNYKLKGHGNIFSGYDQLLAMFNIKEWYSAITRAGKGKGWSPRGPRVKPYANGGIVTKAHMGLVGEDGPEAIIPLDKAKKGRSMQLLAQASQYLNGNKATTGKTDNQMISILSKQIELLNQQVSLLSQLVAKETTFVMDNKVVAQGVNSFNRQQEKMTNRAKGLTM